MAFNRPDNSERGDDDGNLLKRRLLGAAVLIALAVIFLPLLLDGSGSESRFRRVEQLRVEPPRILDSNGQIELPAKPVIAPPVVTVDTEVPVTPPADEPEDADTAKRVERKAVPAPESAAATQVAVPAPAVAPSAVPVDDKIVDQVAWIIQAGSFGDEANATSVRDELRESGFPAFITEAGDATGALYRVKVGPITDRQQALKVQARVQTQLGQPTIIKQYP